jgi:hypothetical protein
MADQDPHHDPDDDDEFDDSGLPLFEDLDQHEQMHPGDIELEKIPRRFWEQTLAPFHRSIRAGIAHRVPDERLRALAFEVAVEIDHAAADARNARDEARYAARRTGYPLPMPHGGHAVAQPTKQVNIRLRADDHERLTEAARCVELRPATLARALVLNGAAQILREHAGSADPRDVRSRTPGYP